MCPSYSPVELLCFDALLPRFVVCKYFRGGGHKYDCSGRENMLLNHNHYINFNSAAMNGCSARVNSGSRA